ncbi:MAG: DJ-1/PfpI family protein [Prolixibacteraceae bacterium]|nr:DJ-1/PfpI family protein [Prolixibacteraceae bacterium]
MKRAAIFFAEGFEEIEAISIVDVLRRASIIVTTVSITGNTKVIGSHEIPVITDEIFENIDFSVFDMLILPGGMPGAKNLNGHEGLKKLILQFNESKKYLGAICAAPLVFGQLGILNGKKATCYPGFEAYLTGAKITDSPTEVDNNIITGRGAGVAIDFALKIVEQLKSKELAKELAVKMVVKD